MLFFKYDYNDINIIYYIIIINSLFYYFIIIIIVDLSIGEVSDDESPYTKRRLHTKYYIQHVKNKQCTCVHRQNNRTVHLLRV